MNEKEFEEFESSMWLETMGYSALQWHHIRALAKIRLRKMELGLSEPSYDLLKYPSRSCMVFVANFL